MERSGLIVRRVLAFSPVAVESAIGVLGRTLEAPTAARYAWGVDDTRFDRLSCALVDSLCFPRRIHVVRIREDLGRAPQHG